MAVFTVTLCGGGPWGLRLIGGHNDPLLIARLRKRSKAEEAGLQESDELVSINGQLCASLSHGTAMAMLENSSHLTLEVARAGGGHAASSAVPPLGPPASAGEAGDEQRTSSAKLQLQAPPPARGMVNGDSRFQQRFQTDDGGTHTVKGSTSTLQFGSSSLTKVSREITSDYGPRIDTQGPQSPQGLFSPVPSPGGASPYQVPSPRQMFSPSGAPPPQFQKPPPQHFSTAGPPGPPGPNQQAPSPRQMFSPAPHDTEAPPPQQAVFKNPSANTGQPNMWQPGGGSAAGPAPSNGPSVPPPQQPMPSVGPVGPKFNVRNMSNVTTQEAYGMWAPGGKAGPPKVSPRPMTPPRDEPPSSGPAIWEPPKAKFRDIVDTGPRQPPAPAPPPPQFTNGGPTAPPPPPPQFTNGGPNMYGNNMRDSPVYDTYPTNPDTLPHVDLNRLLREGSSEGSGMNTPNRKKKIYADSAFYNDPEAKYPTIEEQIKMARKVAMSLTSPANKRARGHQMFNRRRERSDTWIAGTGMEPEQDIYYNPEPWMKRAGPHTWQPDRPTSSYGPSAPTPMPSSLDPWMAPSYQEYGEQQEYKTKALSSEEFERMRLYEEKTLHNTVSPQVCFNLASDLRNTKGRAGQMFAKRRAKADEHVIDESNVRLGGGPDPNIMAKLVADKAPAPARKKDVPDSKSRPVPKPEISPWEAAIGGSVDAAFSHLNRGLAAGTAPSGYGAPVPDKFNTTSASKLEQGGGISALDCQNFNRRARGWGAMGGGPSAASPAASPAAPPQQNQWPGPQQVPQQWPVSSGASAAAPPPQWQSGAGAAAPAQPSGFSDL